ncbi:putative LPS assembly protein LptD [Pontibacter fetidus]|uniref:LPS-assembly protein LptD n=1 Tax=Pontibacter fetidus TaxID=2700082 RepID=A0A6B2H7S8_9BACT|nr:putative LPS assembly protein LptD [Pontibacter fetidus]NDK57016.1 LPS-assembly protein LptD [Pontibacter fetidus]
MRHILIFSLLLQLAVLAPFWALAQRTPARSIRPVKTPQDTVKRDSVTLPAPKGDIETTIKYSARDSIQLEANNKVVHLYGDAKINYGSMTLEAAYIQIDYEKNTLTATSVTDSSGKDIGVPVFVDGAETYSAKRIAYNYKTKRGRIAEVVTQQGEGFIHSEIVKKNEANEIFGLHNKYTTCNLAHPHFYINAGKIKAIPNDKVMSGPFNLVIGDIPTPLGFLFGLFPTPKNNRSSGVIVPSFGENSLRGFYLMNGGYYLALNDYIGASITGDVYSLGGYDLRLNADYNKRYSYRGNFGIEHTYFKIDEADVARSRSTGDIFDQIPDSRRTIFVRWSHSPVQKPGKGRFTASVNAGSSIHNQITGNTRTADRLAASFNSSISYQKNIQNTPFSYTVKLSQGQNPDGQMNFVLPDMNFSMSSISLYEALTKNTPTGRWYEGITVGYNVNAKSTLSNRTERTAANFGGVDVIGGNDTIREISLNDFTTLWENGRRSATHNFDINLGSYKLFKYFTLSPGVNYSETWTDRKYTFRYDPDSNALDVDTAGFGRVYDYSASASLSTNIYGTMYVKGKRVEAIRHMIRPSVSYIYKPDFGDPYFGFYQNLYVGENTNGQPRYEMLRRFDSGVPGFGLQSALSFGITNNLEMKVKSKTDTTGKAFEKVSLIDNFGIRGAYNFAADSLKMSQITMNLNTRLFKVVNIGFNSSFTPYESDSLGRPVDRYLLNGPGFKPARLINAGLQISTNLNPQARRTQTSTPNNLPTLTQKPNPFEPDYVDFKIPWSLNIDYTLNFTRGLGSNPNTIANTVGVDGDVSLTDKWKIGYYASYDIIEQELSSARLNIHRDLHCWDMSISWTPFGYIRGYNLTISARSALLRDLKLTKRSSTSGINFR